MGRTAKNRTRSLFLHDELLPVLRERAMSTANLPLFRTADGEAERFPRKRFENARKTAKLDELPFYTCRHTFATWLLESGTRDEETRAALMGHRLPGLTARYSHVTWDMIREAIRKLPCVTQAGREEAETDVEAKATG